MSRERALCSQHVDGRWYVVVVLLGVPGSLYPEIIWPKGAATPTPAQRRDALADLGYQAAPDAEWEWTEAYPNPDHDTATVEFIAAIDVQPIGGDQQ